MRDHRSLKAFQIAHRLTVELYKMTAQWPSDEKFGLTNQVRRAAVSTSSNIVEGCSRNSQREWYRFLEISFGSAREVRYQISLAKELGFLVGAAEESLSEECCRVIHGLLKTAE